MTQPRTQSGLSTADMVAASEGSRPQEDLAARHAAPQSADPRPTGAAAQRQDSRPAATAASRPAMRDGAETTALVPAEQADAYHTRWEEIQTGFVDEPRDAVEQADHLVAEVIKRVAEVFADERGKLEAQWSQGNQVDTEQLRVALKRYRSFFERLLAA